MWVVATGYHTIERSPLVTGERERWEEEGEEGGESGAVGQEEGEVHQRMVDVGRCGGRCPKPEEQCIR